MKRLTLVLIMLLVFANEAFATTSFTILEKQVTVERGMKVLVIFTEHKIDGVVQVSSYPSDLAGIQARGYPKTLVGKEYFITRYKARAFKGMTPAQVRQEIRRDINTHSRWLFQEKFKQASSTKLISQGDEFTTVRNEDSRVQDIFDNGLGALIGATQTNDKIKVRVDTDVDGTADEEWEIETDGTKTVTNLP